MQHAQAHGRLTCTPRAPQVHTPWCQRRSPLPAGALRDWLRVCSVDCPKSPRQGLAQGCANQPPAQGQGWGRSGASSVCAPRADRAAGEGSLALPTPAALVLSITAVWWVCLRERVGVRPSPF